VRILPVFGLSVPQESTVSAEALASALGTVEALWETLDACAAEGAEAHELSLLVQGRLAQVRVILEAAVPAHLAHLVGGEVCRPVAAELVTCAPARAPQRG
jgi:hypothetical protein